MPVIRPYTPSDEAVCKEMFLSNCPPYFDTEELPLFMRYLGHFNDPATPVPAYRDAESDAFYVIEQNGRVVGCGGYYVLRDKPHARLAWGMIDRSHHRQGFGLALLKYRLEEIGRLRPDCSIGIDTSQYTAPFFERFGFKRLSVEKDGYGQGLDKWEMVLANQA